MGFWTHLVFSEVPTLSELCKFWVSLGTQLSKVDMLDIWGKKNIKEMDVSKNRGPGPQNGWFFFHGKSYLKWMIWGYPYFWHIQIVPVCSLLPSASIFFWAGFPVPKKNTFSQPIWSTRGWLMVQKSGKNSPVEVGSLSTIIYLVGFQPIWKIWVKMDHFPKIGLKISNIWVATTLLLMVSFCYISAVKWSW